MRHMNLRRYFPDPFNFCIVIGRLVVVDPPIYGRQSFTCCNAGLAHPIGCQQNPIDHDARQKTNTTVCFFRGAGG